MLSIAGVRCDRTSVLTPASYAMRPTSSDGVWSALICAMKASNLTGRPLSISVFQVFLQSRHVHGLMHKHVGALVHVSDGLQWRSVAGKGDRAVLKVETIRQRRLHRRMLDDEETLTLSSCITAPAAGISCTLTAVSGFM